jgi:hypothetical protein
METSMHKLRIPLVVGNTPNHSNPVPWRDAGAASDSVKKEKKKKKQEELRDQPELVNRECVIIFREPNPPAGGAREVLHGKREPHQNRREWGCDLAVVASRIALKDITHTHTQKKKKKHKFENRKETKSS